MGGRTTRHINWAAAIATVAMITTVCMATIFANPKSRVIVQGNQTGRRQFVSITPDRAFDRMVNNAYPVGN